jgi:multisubunit Na+/H+ antiporter MnhB subunit
VNPSPYWGFEFIRIAAESGSRGHFLAIIVTLLGGLVAVVLGVAYGAPGLALVGTLSTIVALSWAVQRMASARRAHRLERRAALDDERARLGDAFPH